MNELKFSGRRLFVLLSAGWLLINLLQALFTEVISDEAYYSLYGKNLAWGYFDHPPMVAVMTHISSWFFAGNLGIRFMTVILQIATLLIIWAQVDKKEGNQNKKILLFFIVAASLVMFSVYGFITTPDGPLLFFTALFLFGYKDFLVNENWKSVLILSLSMAGLVYSKYQGVLVIGIVVLSNIRLLINPKFLSAGILAIIMCIPHFYWHYVNDFPSFRYHLMDRSTKFKWSYFIEYLPNQLATFNPFTFIAVLYVLFKYKAATKYERALYFLIVCLILFFWISTFRGHVEPQWTVAASIPMLILLTNKFTNDKWLHNFCFKFIGGSLILVLIARVILVTDLLPERLGFTGKLSKYSAFERVAGKKPVVFNASYQNPSLYTFFTGNPATVISSLKSRKTQFDIWNFENNWFDDTVFVVGKFDGRSDTYTVHDRKIDGFFADSIQSSKQLNITYSPVSDSFQTGDTIQIDFVIENLSENDIYFENADFPVSIEVILLHGSDFTEIEGTLKREITVMRPNEKIDNSISIFIPEINKGSYKLGLGCKSIFGPTLNSDVRNITVY